MPYVWTKTLCTYYREFFAGGDAASYKSGCLRHWWERGRRGGEYQRDQQRERQYRDPHAWTGDGDGDPDHAGQPDGDCPTGAQRRYGGQSEIVEQLLLRHHGDRDLYRDLPFPGL